LSPATTPVDHREAASIFLSVALRDAGRVLAALKSRSLIFFNSAGSFDHPIFAADERAEPTRRETARHGPRKAHGA
jgi:hypothetical protein